MKTVGKQLQEARLARNWTPELAARETKIKVDRLRDLEADDYSHFSSPTYARGFVRTYARALGLDEYRILRQLDNRLPDDDSANIVTDGGVAYLPETALPPRVAHRDNTGLYIVAGLGVIVALVAVIVLVQAYRVGELPGYFKSTQETAAVSAATPVNASGDTTARALPLDSNTPPPIVDTTNAPAVAKAAPVPAASVASTPAAAPSDSSVATLAPVAPRALPVDASATASAAIPTPAPAPVAPRALPVDPSQLASGDASGSAVAPRALPVNAADVSNPSANPPVTPAPAVTPVINPPPVPATPAPSENAPAVDTANAPRALPVDPNAPDATAAGATASTVVAANTATANPGAPVNAPVPAATQPSQPTQPSQSSKPIDNGPVIEPSQPPVPPAPEVNSTTPAPAAAETNAAPAPAPITPVPAPAPQTSATPAASPGDSDKRLVLTASQDSFVRVTDLDGPEADKPLYAAVLHSGQSVGFDGRKFSINVGVPSAVDIRLDGVNYGPHSDQDAPETFVVQSHMP